MSSLSAIVTQNVDSLHQRAAEAIGRTTEILELHGTLARTRCVGCGREHGDATELARALAARSEAPPPRCACGGIVRPDVVLFGERARGVPESIVHVERADLVLHEPLGATLTATCERLGLQVQTEANATT